jgi:POT family proton-dependent oligopeptide transporter
MGEQLAAADREVAERAYRWLRVAVSAGALAATLAVPLLLARSGPRAALALPGVLMVGAVALLWAGRRHYVRAPPAGPSPHGLLRVVRRAVSKLGTGPRGQHWLAAARDAHPAEAVEGVRAVLRIAGVFAAVTLFWALFDQKGSSWVFQARRLDLTFLGHQASPAQLQALNPLLALALAPLLGRVVFPALERRGVALPPLRRMTWGMFATVLAFVAAAILQTLVDAGRAPHALWQLPQYVLLTIGEVLVSVTGLEFSYAQAPHSMRGTITSIWFLAVSAGNVLTAAVTALVRLEGAAYFWTFAGLMLVAAVVFRAVAGRYRGAPVQIEPAG